jgi:glutathione synthase/RimK-type ligase-like ATP-grasp enzyme
MASIAILSPDPADQGYRTRWREVLARNAEPLLRAGFKVEAPSWAGENDLAGYDLVLPLLTWGYVRAHAQWLDRVADWEAWGVRLQNPPSVLRWNANKRYLGCLDERGAPVVPTLYSDRLTEEVLAEALAAFGTDRLVAKPQVSSTGWQTIRWSPGQRLEGGPEGRAMVQPYLPEIERSGETSFIYFAGRFSHAIRKVPQPGDFRVQPEYHGIITRYDPQPDELAAAERIIGAVEESLLYARVDLVRGLEGHPALIELELIEPDLYLGWDPAEGAMFAAAAAELIERSPLSPR